MDPVTRMEADLELRNLSRATQEEYLRVVRLFLGRYRKPAAKLGAKEVRKYLLDGQQRGRGPSTLKVYRAALQFFFATTLRRPKAVCPGSSTSSRSAST